MDIALICRLCKTCRDAERLVLEIMWTYSSHHCCLAGGAITSEQE